MTLRPVASAARGVAQELGRGQRRAVAQLWQHRLAQGDTFHSTLPLTIASLAFIP